MAQSTVYSWGIDFQRKILASVLRDPQFLRNYRDVVDPAYFEADQHQTLSRLAKDLWEKFEELPTRHTFEAEVADMCQRLKLRDDIKQRLLIEVSRLYSEDISDAAIVLERVLRFGKRQALRGAVVSIIDDLEADANFDSAVDKVQKALLVGHGLHSTGVNVLRRMVDLPERLREKERLKPRVPTLLPGLDKALGGGPKRGDLCVILAMPGGGKSALLTFIAGSAVKQHIPVAHVTLGDLDEDDQELRAAARLTYVDQRDIVAGSDLYLKRAVRLEGTRGYWQIKYWASEEATIGDIRAWLSRLIVQDNVKPGIVIVDYADEIRGTEDDSFRRLGRIYSGLSKIADDFECVVWTGSQVQRATPLREDEVLTMGRASESWQKAWKPDLIVSWNQSPLEYDNGVGRLYVDKVRKGIRNQTFQCDCDFSKMHFRDVESTDDSAAGS